MNDDLDYEIIEFPLSKNSFSKIEKKNNICINEFCYENKLTCSIYVSDHKFENYMNLLMISDENKSHFVCMKNFNRFICNNIKCKKKKHFRRYYLQCFSSENVLTEHKKLFDNKC